MADTFEELAQAGRDAAARSAWSEAFDFLARADASGRLDLDDLEALATSAFWTGRLAACIPARERAYALQVAAGDRRRAGRLAVELAHDYSLKAIPSVADAWLRHAERLLGDEPEGVEHGWLARFRAEAALERGDIEQALQHSQRTLEIGTHTGDRDLQALGLHDQGRALAASGRLADGLAMIDEATVAAVSGELGLYATAVVYCNTIVAYRDLAEYRRAGVWTDAATRWCERQALNGFPGICRVFKAEVMRLRGAWSEAEDEARRAADELRDFSIGYAGHAFAEIGQIRLRVGDLAGAERAFHQAHELGVTPQPGLAVLRLAEGKVEAALRSIRQALADEPRNRFARARLLPAAVEAAVAARELDEARAAAAELEAIAADYGGTALQAAAATARGMVELADGDPARAQQSLRRACQLWHEVDAPYEAARTAMLLAAAYGATGNHEDARLELAAARALFERLGALRDARRAARLSADGGHREGTLSRRERQVADLVAQGLSNRDIAQMLGISERTADTHVHRILNKLGFSSRAQIAAWAATAGLDTPAGL